jgi:hypothetical protein
MAQILQEPLGYHHYHAQHFISNFNHKFKDLMKMSYKPLRCKFDVWFLRICKLDLTYQEWFEREAKEK